MVWVLRRPRSELIADRFGVVGYFKAFLSTAFLLRPWVDEFSYAILMGRETSDSHVGRAVSLTFDLPIEPVCEYTGVNGVSRRWWGIGVTTTTCAGCVWRHVAEEFVVASACARSGAARADSSSSPDLRAHFRGATALTNRLIGLLKIVVPLALVVWLCHHVWNEHPEAIRTLRDGEVRIDLLFAAFACILAAHLTSIFRWHQLLRALMIRIRLMDTLRLGFLGQLFSFVSLGQVGGDLFKAVFIARERSDRRAAAVATIMVDRACGLYGLLVMTTLALLASNVGAMNDQVAAIAKMTYLLTIVGGIVIILALTPSIANSPLAYRLTEIPLVGRLFAKGLSALRLYQRQPRVLFTVGLMSLMIHSLLAVGIFLIARSIYPQTPTLLDHFVISPLACVAGALPIAPAGLGTFELALTYLYDLLSPPDAQGRGILIAILFRPTTLIVASIGVVFYWLNHREVQKVLRQTEEAAEPSPASEATSAR